MSENNAALKEALSTAKANAGQLSSTEAEIRMPVNIPVSYKNKLKVMAAVEDTTMKTLIIEALEKLFDSRGIK
jgi:hypothetical protein